MMIFTTAAVCIAVPTWFWCVLVVLFSLSLASAVASSPWTCRDHHIWGLNRDPDMTHARREQERRPQHDVATRDKKQQRILDRIKPDANSRPKSATRCSRIGSMKIGVTTNSGNDLNWAEKEEIFTSDDEKSERGRRQPRLGSRGERRPRKSGRPYFRWQTRPFHLKRQDLKRQDLRRQEEVNQPPFRCFGPSSTYSLLCLLEALCEAIVSKKRNIPAFENLTMSASEQQTASTRSTPQSSSVADTVPVPPQSVFPPVTVMHPLPLLGTPGAPSAFDGRNVSTFIRKFEAMCNNFGVSNCNKARRIPEYCDDDVARDVESFATWKTGDWDGLKTDMLEEWRRGDVEQLMYTRPLLEEFVNQPREKDGLKLYYRQFERISTALTNKGELDDYTRGRLFVMGLPEAVRRTVLTKPESSTDSATGTVNYDMALKIVKEVVIAEERIENFFVRPERQSEISNLASAMNEPKTSLSADQSKPSDNAEKGKKKGDHVEDVVDALTKSFGALTLPLTAAINKLEAATTKASEKPMETPGAPRFTRFDRPPFDPAYDRFPRTNARTGRDGYTWTCYMCGKQGHTLNRCEHTARLLEAGQIHFNDDHRPCLGTKREDAMPVMRHPDLTLLETIEKQLKMRAPPPPSVSLIQAIVDHDTDVEIEDIGRTPPSADTFAARAEVRKDKARGDGSAVTDPVRDPRTRVVKQILRRQDKYPVLKSPRTGTWEQPEGESVGTIPESVPQETVVEREETMQDTVTVEASPPAQPVKEKTPKTTLKKILAGHADPMRVIDRMLSQAVTITWAEALSLSGDLRKVMFGSFIDPKADATQPLPIQLSNVSARIEVEEDLTPEYVDPKSRVLYIAASPKAKVQIAGEEVTALIDTGAEVCVMSSGLAEKLQLPISRTFSVTMAGATGKTKRFLGLCEDVPIDIGKIVYKVPIWVIHRLEHSLVLGRPYHKAAQLKLREMPEGGTEATIYTPDGTGMTSWVAVRPREERDQTRQDLLQKQALNS
jgi:hypothetical protein